MLAFSMSDQRKLPWSEGNRPLMLAPMQGITNRALRSLFVEKYAPDVVFTEFVRVRSSARKPVSKSDCLEAASSGKRVPLIVQLIGGDTPVLIEAAKIVQDLGAEHININLGCPYGRMVNKRSGGALLGVPSRVKDILTGLRPHVLGSFSVKLRSGIEDSAGLPALISLFEECGVDFIILHPRTVRQEYGGIADHRVTARTVKQTTLPVIANGDIFTASDGRKVLDQTGSAGLMLGRGAINDPFLFERIRGRYNEESEPEMRVKELKQYLLALLDRYMDIFYGDKQVLSKMKEIVQQIRDPEYRKTAGKLLKTKRIDQFAETLDNVS